MPVDPAIQGMLDLLESLDRPPMHEGTAEDARRAFRTLTVDLRSPDAVVAVAGVADLAIPAGDHEMPARIYRPHRVENGSVPTIAFFHGGGFVIGDLDTHDNQCRWVCEQVGAVVVSVGYRLAPEAPFPSAVSDCLAATRWVAEHAAELGGDAERLVVAGDSAGGNLAAVVAQACRDEGGPALAAQLLIYPAVDFTDEAGEVYPSRVENAEGYFLTLEDMAWFTENYVPDGSDPAHPHLSPIQHDLSGLPPAVVVTAEFDPLRDEGDAYAAALRDAGVEVWHRCYEGMIHAFFDLPALSPAAAMAVTETCAALCDLLEPR